MVRTYYWSVDRSEAKRRREALDASLQDVASLAGISDETVRKFENGGNVKQKYAEAIEVALDSLEMIKAVVADVKAKQGSEPVVPLPERLTRIENDLAELKRLILQLLAERSV